MNKKTKERIKNKIKDYLKLFLLIGIVTSLWVFACILSNFIK